MEGKIGVFICTGYGIAEAVDVDALCEVVTSDCEVPFCKTLETCEGPGLNSIIEEIENQILPSNAQSQEQALRLYNVMNANVYDLLDRKREEFDIQMNLVDVRAFFWSSKARLLRAAGGAI